MRHNLFRALSFVLTLAVHSCSLDAALALPKITGVRPEKVPSTKYTDREISPLVYNTVLSDIAHFMGEKRVRNSEVTIGELFRRFNITEGKFHFKLVATGGWIDAQGLYLEGYRQVGYADFPAFTIIVLRD